MADDANKEEAKGRVGGSDPRQNPAAQGNTENPARPPTPPLAAAESPMQQVAPAQPGVFIPKDEPAPTPEAALEEAHIVEETVTRPAPGSVKAEVVAMSPSLPTATAPPLAPNAPQAPISPPSPTPPPAPTSPSRDAAPPLVSQSAPQTLAAPPSQPASPQEAPPHASEEQGKEQAEIAKILAEAKLPERVAVPGQNEKLREARVFDTTLGQNAATNAETIEEAPPQPPALPPSSNNLASSIVAPLRTFKNDLQEIVRERRISLVRAAALESDKRRVSHSLEERAVKEARAKRTFRVLFTILLLSILGAAAFFGVFVIMEERSGIPSRTDPESILFSESTYSISLENQTPLEAKRFLAQTRLDSSAILGSITRFVPTVDTTTEQGDVITTAAPLSTFLQQLGAGAPEDLVRALSDTFFFGIHTVDENAPLFVIPVVSYERAFAGMLAWEDAMNRSLAPVFTPVPDQVIGPNGLPEKRRFDDVVMRNYDVRALRDNSGVVELYYSFPTRQLLIIGESVYSFAEILNRLRAEQKL